jgi:hypothetical protein
MNYTRELKGYVASVHDFGRSIVLCELTEISEQFSAFIFRVEIYVYGDLTNSMT